MHARLAVLSSIAVLLSLLTTLLPTGSALANDGWYAQTSPVTTTLNGVDFVDADHGWICGDDGVILRTSDGGEHWGVQFSGTTANLKSISFADLQVGFAVGAGKIQLKTTNGGTSWQTIHGEEQDLPWEAVQALDAEHVWCVGTTIGSPYTSGAIEWSTNGGTTWAGYGVPCVDVPPHYYCGTAMQAVSVVNPQVAFFSGYRMRYDYSTDGIVYKTTDGGATFQQLVGHGTGCPGIQFLNPFVGYVTDGQMNKSTDGGVTWEYHDLGYVAWHLSFVDTERGWVVGWGGNVVRTTDGGDTWDTQATGTSEDLNDVDFATAWAGTVVGNHGLILHTITGGEAGTGVSDLDRGGGGRLLPPAPNPFSDQAWITYELPAAAEVSLEIYDASGRLLNSLDGGTRTVGRHSVSWNGTDASGRAVDPRDLFHSPERPAGNRRQATGHDRPVT